MSFAPGSSPNDRRRVIPAIGPAGNRYYPGWPPHPLASPEQYRGVLLRRLLAYVVDVWILGVILVVLWIALGLLTVLSFGLLWPLHVILPILVVFAYHSLQLSSPAAATIGMRLFGVRAWSLGAALPTLPQAILHTFLLYVVLSFGGGILQLVALFNAERRCLHDFGAGIVVLRAI